MKCAKEVPVDECPDPKTNLFSAGLVSLRAVYNNLFHDLRAVHRTRCAVTQCCVKKLLGVKEDSISFKRKNSSLSLRSVKKMARSRVLANSRCTQGGHLIMHTVIKKKQCFILCVFFCVNYTN